MTCEANDKPCTHKLVTRVTIMDEKRKHREEEVHLRGPDAGVGNKDKWGLWVE